MQGPGGRAEPMFLQSLLNMVRFRRRLRLRCCMQAMQSLICNLR